MLPVGGATVDRTRDQTEDGAEVMTINAVRGLSWLPDVTTIRDGAAITMVGADPGAEMITTIIMDGVAPGAGTEAMITEGMMANVAQD